MTFIIPTGYVVTLTVLWFLFYWVFGGAIFALLAIFRVGRLSKARFSCLFTLGSVVIAYATARLGIFWAGDEVAQCIPPALSRLEHFVAWFGCGISSYMLAFFVGAGAMLVMGFLVLILSSRRAQTVEQKETQAAPTHHSSMP